MEKISKYNDKYLYGSIECATIEDAYLLFRDDYHKSLGNDAYNRLDRIGSRKERLHKYGFVFDTPPTKANGPTRINCYIMGLVGISYVRMIGCWWYSDVNEDDFEEWVDFIFTRDRESLRTLGTRDKVGRTSKRLKKRY